MYSSNFIFYSTTRRKVNLNILVVLISVLGNLAANGSRDDRNHFLKADVLKVLRPIMMSNTAEDNSIVAAMAIAHLVGQSDEIGKILSKDEVDMMIATVLLLSSACVRYAQTDAHALADSGLSSRVY